MVAMHYRTVFYAGNNEFLEQQEFGTYCEAVECAMDPVDSDVQVILVQEVDENEYGGLRVETVSSMLCR